MRTRRTALLLTVVGVVAGALGGLLHSPVAQPRGTTLLVPALLAGTLATPTCVDLAGLGAAALGLSTLLIAGLARRLFGSSDGSGGGDPIGRLLLTGLAAAGLLAGTVSLILRLSRRQAARLDGDVA